MRRASTRVLREGKGDIAVFVPFTREWCVERFFASLAASDVPFHRSRLVVYVDSDSQALVDAVSEAALAIPFAEVVVHCSAWAPPAEFAKSRERRGRHSAMRTASVGLIPKSAKYLLLLEDDTTVPAQTWKKLRAGLTKGYDWVSGFEVGRWHCPCPGIWNLDGRTRASATPGTGLEDCDSTGVYLVLTRPDVYRAAAWDVWDNNYGHDVSIVWLLKKAGYRIGVDWSLECVHMTQDGDLTVDMWGPVSKKMPPFQPVLQDNPRAAPLTEFQDSGPRLVKGAREWRDSSDLIPREKTGKMHRLGKSGEFDGVYYEEGCYITHETAVSMSAAGFLKARLT